MSQTNGVVCPFAGETVSGCHSDRLHVAKKRDEAVKLDDTAHPPAQKKSKQGKGSTCKSSEDSKDSTSTSQKHSVETPQSSVHVQDCDQEAMTACASTGSPLKEAFLESVETQSDSFGVEASTEEELMAMEGTLEHLKTLLCQEYEGYPGFTNYLTKAATSSVPSKDRVSEAWRRKLCEWCFEVVDHFSFDREVVTFALNYLDRTAAVKSETYQDDAMPKRDYQLLAVTSLYMAIKIHGETDSKEGPRRRLRVSAFVELSRGFFSVDVIEATERDILETLHWRINPPTYLRFMTSLFALCPKWSSDEGHPTHASSIGGIYDVARYLTELSECVSSFAFTYKTSITAYASILCAIEALHSSQPLPDSVRVAFINNMSVATGFDPSDEYVFPVCSKLKELCPAMFKTGPCFTECIQQLTVEKLTVDAAPTDYGKVSPVSVVSAPAGDYQHFNHAHDVHKQEERRDFRNS